MEDALKIKPAHGVVIDQIGSRDQGEREHCRNSCRAGSINPKVRDQEEHQRRRRDQIRLPSGRGKQRSRIESETARQESSSSLVEHA